MNLFLQKVLNVMRFEYGGIKVHATSLTEEFAKMNSSVPKVA